MPTNARRRRVNLARTGAIGLIVPDVSSALAKIERLTQEQFGAVTALQDDAPSTPGEKHTAQATVSVPDDRFARTLDALATLGGVTSRSVTTEDLTDSIVDNAARLRNLRHEEADLLRIMDRSGKIEDVLDVEQQLASTRQSIEELDAQGKAMQTARDVRHDHDRPVGREDGAGCGTGRRLTGRRRVANRSAPGGSVHALGRRAGFPADRIPAVSRDPLRSAPTCSLGGCVPGTDPAESL